MKLASFHEHIDNGGISFSVDQTDDEYKQVMVSMNTSYFGYPDITAHMHIWSTGSYKHSRSPKQILEEIGKMFLEAAGQIN